MPIDKNAPVSKIIVDDEEIPLATGGSGGEEVKQETYTGSQIATYYAKIRELFNAGKLWNVYLTFKNDTVIEGMGKATIDENSYAKADYSVTVAAGTIVVCAPARVTASNIYFTSTLGDGFCRFFMSNSTVNAYNTLFNMTSTKSVVYGHTAEGLDLSTFTVTLNYFA